MQLPYYIDLIGTLVFAVSGALAASDKNMYRDIFGVTFTGFVTAVGGGTLRDMILGVRPTWVVDGNYLIAITLGVIIAISFKYYILKYRRTFFLFDTLGIALYTVVGVQKALFYDVAPLAAIIMGMFSAVMGGVIRDTLINEVPLIFKKEIYATACLSGAAVFVLLKLLNVDDNMNSFISVGVIILIRTISVKYQLTLPKVGSKKSA
ncbi:trimeric intracellular cation channel family protein [Daejeonella sp.]|uniref:trimeric intracellular cation channel family protein n=2 Tax=Daejeonella sp. TaxID=2805397 RepID=UPI002716902E|nr:trimeric intracellular cation channel family protein [Daejeonella sp.]MDO8992124.1 trimeric intracellular cation channel family protein [Daejeonella sp.]MDP2412277.1 trimeric intracellular cation channel family protein [Daejeonella sp.]